MAPTPRSLRPPDDEIPEGELEAEVEQQQDQADLGQQLEVLGMLHEVDARACWGRAGCRPP